MMRRTCEAGQKERETDSKRDQRQRTSSPHICARSDPFKSPTEARGNVVDVVTASSTNERQRSAPTSELRRPCASDSCLRTFDTTIDERDAVCYTRRPSSSVVVCV